MSHSVVTPELRRLLVYTGESPYGVVGAGVDCGEGCYCKYCRARFGFCNDAGQLHGSLARCTNDAGALDCSKAQLPFLAALRAQVQCRGC
jgi:hypothetical protein